MKLYTHKLGIHEMRNAERLKDDILEAVKEVNTKEYNILELDFSNIEQPVIAPVISVLHDTIITGFSKIIITNHRYKDFFIEVPTAENLIRSGQLEFV